MNQCKI